MHANNNNAMMNRYYYGYLKSPVTIILYHYSGHRHKASAIELSKYICRCKDARLHALSAGKLFAMTQNTAAPQWKQDMPTLSGRKIPNPDIEEG